MPVNNVSLLHVCDGSVKRDEPNHVPALAKGKSQSRPGRPRRLPSFLSRAMRPIAAKACQGLSILGNLVTSVLCMSCRSRRKSDGYMYLCLQAVRGGQSIFQVKCWARLRHGLFWREARLGSFVAEEVVVGERLLRHCLTGVRRTRVFWSPLKERMHSDERKCLVKGFGV